MSLTIEQVDNGYIVTGLHGRKVFHDLEDVFQQALGHFEGRFKNLDKSAYGLVIIHREHPAEAQIVLGGCVSPGVPFPMDEARG